MNIRTWLRAEWDHVGGYALIAVGLILATAVYLGARHTPYSVVALPYVASGGIGGLFSLGLGPPCCYPPICDAGRRKLDRIESGRNARTDLDQRSDPIGNHWRNDADAFARQP